MSANEELLTQSAVELRRRIGTKEISPVELLAACIARIRKSPDPSPVNTRPVRFAPCAAGARPRTSTRASGSPKPGTGRPQ